MNEESSGFAIAKEVGGHHLHVLRCTYIKSVRICTWWYKEHGGNDTNIHD